MNLLDMSAFLSSIVQNAAGNFGKMRRLTVSAAAVTMVTEINKI